MARSLRKQVAARARSQCEYCQLPQEYTNLPHEIDHIRARKHHGRTTLANTCFACGGCNAAKSSNAAGYDPETDELVRLFNPRQDDWREHFEWDGPTLVGNTPIGRTTIDVLRINQLERVQLRALLIRAGVFPPLQV